MRKIKRKGRVPPFVKKAEDAMRIAVSKVIKEHRRRREPIVIWKKGKVVKVPA